MKTRLILALKYIFFAFAAFTVPKMIVDSGRIVAPLEPSPNAPSRAPSSSSRSFWPFRFLQTSSSAPTSSAPPSVSTFDAASRAPASRFAPEPDAENAFYADFNASIPSNFNGRTRSNASPVETFAAVPSTGSAFGFSGDARDASKLSAPRLSRSYPSDAAFVARPLDDARFDGGASFARFAESQLAPSAESIFADSPSASASPQTFEELFRFGHSPAWLVENWPRVDAVATEDGLVGYRVAAATGAADDDLVGVFTCYFDATSERRVEFSGQTVDYRRILRFLQREYGVALSPRSTVERFVYESTLSNGRGGAVPGRLLVRPNRVVLRGAEKSFFDVDVILER